MANKNSTPEINNARLRFESRSTGCQGNSNCFVNMEDIDANDVTMQGDDDNDNNSIPTTMGVRASCMEFGNRDRSLSFSRDPNENYACNDNISVTGKISSFFIPVPITAAKPTAASVRSINEGQQPKMNTDNSDCDDDVSTLTEYSMEGNEDDNLSQTTANTTRTFVTEGTGSLAYRQSLTIKRPRERRSHCVGYPVLLRDSQKDRVKDQTKRRRKA